MPAIVQAMIAPNPPVACPKLRGSEKTPAPTMEPTTIADKVSNGIFFVAVCSEAVIALLLRIGIGDEADAGRRGGDKGGNHRAYRIGEARTCRSYPAFARPPATVSMSGKF
ncbi:hypothetical protein GCM10011610_37100 [Nocardia rhizosphaerihabitans]|uniref:Uncharacterized protein n=1 Tax=Nocardia rhizosphaerihabitans TaxID=1691570 RepID=A0ABQ2KMA2_9NOCA|nr:hypothetical protein GCM10011610_37100 [Nocardia rhizosphaerihabitans]